MRWQLDSDIYAFAQVINSEKLVEAEPEEGIVLFVA